MGKKNFAGRYVSAFGGTREEDKVIGAIDAQNSKRRPGFKHSYFPAHMRAGRLVESVLVLYYKGKRKVFNGREADKLANLV